MMESNSFDNFIKVQIPTSLCLFQPLKFAYFSRNLLILTKLTDCVTYTSLISVPWEESCFCYSTAISKYVTFSRTIRKDESITTEDQNLFVVNSLNFVTNTFWQVKLSMDVNILVLLLYRSVCNREDSSPPKGLPSHILDIHTQILSRI